MRYSRTPKTSAQPFHLSAVKNYLRVDYSDEDATIYALASAAASEVEEYCDLALLAQTISTTTEAWPGNAIDLPCGPLLEGSPVSVSVVEVDGTLSPVPTGWWIEGGRYPRLHFTTTPGAPLRITYDAGYGVEVGDIPPALSHAIHDQTLRLPEHNLGVQMRVTRKAIKQSGDALESAIRRDMQGAMGASLDRAAFLGTGADGQPLGIITGAATYGVTVTAVDDPATWGAFRSAVTRFMTANAANGPGDVRALIRPEVWSAMDSQQAFAGADMTEWDRMTRNIPASQIAMSSNALAAPTGTPLASTAVLATAAGGFSPFFIGLWGAVDVIRDPFSDAQSGGLRLTALATVDVTVARGVQLEVLTGVEV
jgi:uncharacterized phiE125 gp8 family phage protein